MISNAEPIHKDFEKTVGKPRQGFP
jgi:hypothetical protein